MTIISTKSANWQRAKKTASIRAKPLSSVIVDAVAARVLLIDTLEGKEPAHTENMLCMGAAGDPWQQSVKALLKKYTVTGIDDGWLLCEPKPENEVEFYFAESDGVIQGLWGETIDGQDNMQRVSVGDAIARQTYDHNDQWVVRRKLFDNTYSVL